MGCATVPYLPSSTLLPFSLHFYDPLSRSISPPDMIGKIRTIKNNNTHHHRLQFENSKNQLTGSQREFDKLP
jgi:hypothetical protein